MVGTGANRMPLTKVHPILLGKQNNANGNKSGNSLLAQHRQMHNDRIQQRQQSPGQMGNRPPPPGSQGGQYGHPPPPNQFNNSYNQYNQQGGPRPPMPGYQQPPPPQHQPPPPMSGNKQSQPPPPPQERGRDPTKKRKRSRWGAKDDKVLVTGPAALPSSMTEEQRKHYLVQFKIEEITQKLRTGELGIPPDPADRFVTYINPR